MRAPGVLALLSATIVIPTAAELDKLIDPLVVVAEHELKDTVLKSASDAICPFTEGVSTIHSAEDLAAFETDSGVVKVQPSFASVMVTVNSLLDLLSALLGLVNALLGLLNTLLGLPNTLLGNVLICIC
jgi:hypothetical protein